MDGLIFTHLVDTTEIKDFSCGVTDIDNLIHDYLPEMIASGCVDAYTLRTKSQQLVAVFTLSKGSVTLDSIDLNEMRGDYSDVAPEDMKYTNSDCIELDLLAVDSRFQHQHFGQIIIRDIAINKNLYGFPDEKLILVDAYFHPGYSAIPFYTKCGFYNTHQISGGDTIRMVLAIE